MNRSDPICVLLIENDQEHVRQVEICLRQIKESPLEVIRAGKAPNEAPKKTVDSRAQNMRFELIKTATLAEALGKIAEYHFDIVLVDLMLPDTHGLAVIRSVKQAVDTVPIVALIKDDDIHFAQTTLKAGARGHIVKNAAGYEALVRTMRYVLHRADVETRNHLLVAALEATSNAILITDRNKRIEWVNPAFTELTGYCFQESLGRKPSELLKSGAHKDSFYRQISQTLGSGEHWQGEIINKHKDGSLYHTDVDISPVFNKDHNLTGYVQIQRDITDSVVRLAISEVLQQTIPLKERFTQVLDILFKVKSFDLHCKGGVFLRVKGEDYLALYVLRGEFSAEFIEKEQCVNCGSCLCGRVAVSGQLLVSDDCFCDPLHEHKFTDMQAHGHYIVPLNAGSDILGVLFLYTDPYPLRSENRLAMLRQVGEMMALAIRQEEARTTLETARDMAMQASLVKSEFLANMSHEIRTPMNGVLGMLDLLKDTKLTATQLDWIETAHASAESLLYIINDILDFSKLEAGKFEMEEIDFNLVDLVDDICALLSVRAYAKGLDLNCFLPVSMPLRWRGDPMRIRQVLTNLVGNAVKFTRQGEVYVNVSCKPATDNQHEFRFEVRDTGIGIAPDTLAQLFLPFSQADGATSRRFGGSGLGLSISKKLVELMGGTIGVESRLGAGSCFWFALPLKQAENAETLRLSYDLSDKRALIVDDNATNRRILANYLSGWGMQVNEADNGSSALMELQTSAFNGIPYHLILSDMQMPIMDGLTLAKCLNHIPNVAQTPIILISSGDHFEPSDFENTRITQRLLKPVRQSQLFDAIVNAVQHGPSVAEEREQPQDKAPSFHGKKVLVVEDNKINQKVIAAKLAKFGIEPELAENGQIAIDKLALGIYDLIFMDCQMPVMDGYTATRELRLLEARLGLPRQMVVALTANALEGEREKCLAAGMDDYLTKPIVSGQLHELLANKLGNKAAAKNSISLPAPPKPDNACPVWDEQKATKQLDGDSDLLYEMIGLFLNEGSSLLAELQHAQATEDLSAVAKIAHALKGTISHFCAEKAMNSTLALERAARVGTPEPIKELTNDLEAAVNALLHQLLLAKNHRHPT